MKFSTDNCSLARLTDNPSQPRIAAEAQAMRNILADVDRGFHEWIGSEILRWELARDPDGARRVQAKATLAKASRIQPLTPSIVEEARAAGRYGISLGDAMHLFSALAAGCSVLLTTDDRFIARASRIPNVPVRFVINPIDFLGKR